MTTGTLLHPCDVRRPCADAELRPKPIKNHQKRTSLPPQAREWRQAMAAARGVLGKGGAQCANLTTISRAVWGISVETFRQRQSRMETYAVL